MSYSNKISKAISKSKVSSWSRNKSDCINNNTFIPINKSMNTAVNYQIDEKFFDDFDCSMEEENINGIEKYWNENFNTTNDSNAISFVTVSHGKYIGEGKYNRVDLKMFIDWL